MKFFTISALIALTGLTLAAPIDPPKGAPQGAPTKGAPPRGPPGGKGSQFSQSDITILQFALTVRFKISIYLWLYLLTRHPF